MHLTLPGATASDLFDEEWLVTSSMLASRELGTTVARSHAGSADAIAASVARGLDIRNIERWSSAERRGFMRIAPIVAAAGPASWTRDEKRTMRALLRAKGGDREARYARLLSKHDKFLKSLKKACRRTSPE